MSPFNINKTEVLKPPFKSIKIQLFNTHLFLKNTLKKHKSFIFKKLKEVKKSLFQNYVVLNPLFTHVTSMCIKCIYSRLSFLQESFFEKLSLVKTMYLRCYKF